MQIYDGELFPVFIIGNVDALARLDSCERSAVQGWVDPLDCHASVEPESVVPALSWDEADHADGSVFAVGLVVDAEDIFAVQIDGCGREFGVGSAADAGFAIRAFEIAEAAFLPGAVFEDDVVEDVGVVHVD